MILSKATLPLASFCLVCSTLPSLSFSSNLNSPAFSVRPSSTFSALSSISPVALYSFSKFTALIAAGLSSVASTFSVPSPLSVTLTITVFVVVVFVTPAFVSTSSLTT